jgi:hypothetical protein
MKSLPFILLLCAGGLASVSAQDSLPAVRKTAEAEFSAIDKSYKSDLGALRDQLLLALGKARDAAKKEGDLDGVKAFDAEIERWKAEEDLPLVEPDSPAVSKLNKVYEAAAAVRLVKKQRAVVTWFRSYDERLAELERKLVSSDKIKEAEEVRSERDARRESVVLRDAREAVEAADAANAVARDDKPAAPGPAKSWFNLRSVKWKEAKGNEHFMRNLEKPDGPVSLRGKRLAARDHIFAHASGRIEYEFSKPITDFRSVAGLADEAVKSGLNQTGVYFIVETEEGEVFRSKLVSVSDSSLDIEISFKPTKKLVLVVDANGRDNGDWSLWVNPQYR